MRVALVHDWLIGMRGGERCLEVLLEMYPDADVYTLFYDAKSVTPVISERKVFPSLLNRLPKVGRYYRHLLPLFPFAIKQLGRQLQREHASRPYDLVVSISHCAAKNIPVPSGVSHISYCLTPMRYIWDQYASYFEGKKLEPLIRQIAKYLRRWDVAGAQRVTRFVAISQFVRSRIQRYYTCDAAVAFPPVRTDWIRVARANDPGRGFLAVNALVPYKNVDLIVQAFNQLPETLTIVGSGPEAKKLKEMAGGNIQFVDGLTDDALAGLYRDAKAMVFAAVEDFGMTPVEMQAAGRPVIALRAGGACETVEDGTEKTGVFFDQPDPQAIVKAVREFLTRQAEFTVDKCRKNALRFSREHFEQSFRAIVAEVVPNSAPLKRSVG